MTKKPEPFSQAYQTQWSETHRYKHIHTGEYCTFEAYVAEFIVLRRAEKLRQGKPGYKFWTKGEPLHWLWKKQLGAVRQLRKKYSEEAILSAIQSKDFDRLLVLGVQDGRSYKVNPAAEAVIAKHQRRIEEAEKNKIELNMSPVIEESKPCETRVGKGYNTKTNTMNRLRNL